MKRKNGNALRIGCVLAAAGKVAACSGNGRTDPPVDSPVPLPPARGNVQDVGQENLAHLWPLTVPNGVLSCHADNQVVFTAPEGKEYALNDKAAAAGYADLNPIRAIGSGGDQISLGSLRSKALKLCH